jgi:hypothetical protein
MRELRGGPLVRQLSYSTLRWHSPGERLRIRHPARPSEQPDPAGVRFPFRECDMHIPRTRKPGRQRLPITIALDPTAYAFVEQCASEGWFRSVDDFFEAAVAIFRNHMAALNAYVELEEAKGHSREEALSSAQFEIVFTRQRD